jgi:hypothetical protein
MRFHLNLRCRSGLGVFAFLAPLLGSGLATTVASGQPADQPATPDAKLKAALDRRGWTQLPRPAYRVRHSGPSAAAPEGSLPPVWYQSHVIDGNSRPTPDPEQERAFVASVEAAHRGQTSLVLGGEILLVDGRRRIWAVAAHTPHLLRCYDGVAWTYRRADGLPTPDDAAAAFFRDNPPGARRASRYAAGGLRDLEDPGHWFTPACEDAAGNLHFVGGAASEEAEKHQIGGWGIHTRRPDGSWSFFRIYPVTLSMHEVDLGGLRAVLHRPAAGVAPAVDPPASAPASTRPSGPARPGDLVTLASLRLSDPVAAALGQPVVPIPPDKDPLRRQGWADRSDRARNGPTFLLRFDGRSWRLDRVSIGWGVYDMALSVWPQPDGRVYASNRFGLWVQWPPHLWPAGRIDRLIGDLLAVEPATAATAAETLASLGELALPALRGAVAQASQESSRERIRSATARVEAAVRGEQAAVPAVDGRWQFESAYPEATMPDGRFAFHARKATDLRDGRVVNDCLVFFDPRGPGGESFEVRPIDRPQWRTTDYLDKRAMEPARGSVIDADGGLWVAGGFRCDRQGRLERMVPVGLKLRSPYFVDPGGRVYADNAVANSVSLMVYRAGGDGAAPDGAVAPAAGAATRPDAERVFENVRGVFRQSDVRPPWNAWAVQAAEGGPTRLLRLDGPEPTAVPSPFGNAVVRAVIPLDGGCIAATAKAAGFWDGMRWDVAEDVYGLVERHGRRLAAMAPTRAFAHETSDVGAGGTFVHQLMLAADGAGGLWLAEDSGRAGRRLCHWDGQQFVDLWEKLPLKHGRGEDGGVMTIGGGRALLVHVAPDMDVRPGGYWAVWRVTEEDIREKRVPLQTVRQPGLYPRLLTALGPNTLFSKGLWTDRQGWMWSPTFSDTGQQWVRRRDAKVGHTGLPTQIWPGFSQGPDGPIWFTTGKARDQALVWADVGEPTDDRPGTFPRSAWVGTQIPGMGAASQVVAAPDGRVWLLHEGGLSELRLRRLGPAEVPPLPMRTVGLPPTTRPTTGPATQVAASQATAPADDGSGAAPAPTGWAIDEVARHEWTTPRNDFGSVAFDATGVWFRSGNGPLVRVPQPTPRKPAGDEGAPGPWRRPATTQTSD